MSSVAALVLEADGRGLEAAVHRISAASCFEEVEQYQRALTLLHAAFSVEMRPVYRGRIEKQLKRCRKRANNCVVGKAESWRPLYLIADFASCQSLRAEEFLAYASGY